MTMHQPFSVVGIALAAGLGVLAMASPALALSITANTGIGSLASAQNIDGYASTEFQGNIFDATTVSHTTIHGTMDDSGANYFRFNVGSAGSFGFFDVDCGKHCGESFDPILALFGPAQNLLAINDDYFPLDPGSNHPFDSFISHYTFAAAGEYFLGIARYPNFYGLASGLGGLDGFDGDYTLHVSLSDPSSVTQVPEPSSILLMATGLAGLLGWRKHRRKRAKIS